MSQELLRTVELHTVVALVQGEVVGIRLRVLALVRGVVRQAVLRRSEQVDKVASEVRLELQRLRLKVVLIKTQRATTAQVVFLSALGLRLRKRRSDVFQDAVMWELGRVRVDARALVPTPLTPRLWWALHQVVHVVVVCGLGWSAEQFGLDSARLSLRVRDELLVWRQGITPRFDSEVVCLRELLMHRVAFQPR